MVELHRQDAFSADPSRTPPMVTARYRCSVLVVDDEPSILALLTHQLGHDFDIIAAGTAEQAKSIVGYRPVDIVVTDLQLPDSTGLALLEWVRQVSPQTARVLLSGTAKLKDAAEAINCCQIDRLILKPWRGEDLLAHLKDVARGLLLERSHERLLEEMRTLNLQLEKRVAERTQELRASNQILEKMALTDPLTALPNRRAIDLIARKELLRRARNGSPLAVGLIDADRFKQINTRHFLSGGDHALVCLARVLQHTLRTTDAVGRVGGEEFLIIAPETDRAGAEILSERLRAAVEEADIRFDGHKIDLTVSLGFVVVEGNTPTTYDTLRALAAEALHQAKRGGRNQTQLRVLEAAGVEAN